MLRKWHIFLLMLILFSQGNHAWGQVKGASGLNWYSWSASGGFMLPIDPFNSKLSDDLKHNYRFSGIPGFTFSVTKPITIRFNLGAELQDLIVDGRLKGDENTLADYNYNTRLRTYNLFGQYYLFPNTNINHFLMIKAGYSRINQGLEGEWDPTRSHPGENMWEWIFTPAYGITWHADPNFSVNLYGEFTSIPGRYMGKLSPSLELTEKSHFPMGRIVLSLTGHTDIRVFFPFSKARKYTLQYKPDYYMPFYKTRMNKKSK